MPANLHTNISIYPPLDHLGQASYLLVVCPHWRSWVDAHPARVWARSANGPQGQAGQMPAGMPHQQYSPPRPGHISQVGSEIARLGFDIVDPCLTWVHSCRVCTEVQCRLTRCDSKELCVSANGPPLPAIDLMYDCIL
jgi:hypothetical protein